MFDEFKNKSKPFADAKEIEEYFEIPQSTQKSWRNSNKNNIPYFRVGDTIKYPRQLIALWFEKQIRNKTHIKEVIDQTDKTVSQRENKK